MEALINLDQELFLYLNSIHHPVADTFMLWMSNKFIWIPVYLAIVIVIIRQFGIKSILILVEIALLITLVDQASSSLIKPFIGRLRPCYEPSLSPLIHLVTACGGKFGFVSGHAANSFALATFLWLLFKGKSWKWIFLWPILVSYSRIYLGVHYPLDVIIGGILGSLFAYGMHLIIQRIDQRIFNPL